MNRVLYCDNIGWNHPDYITKLELLLQAIKFGWSQLDLGFTFFNSSEDFKQLCCKCLGINNVKYYQDIHSLYVFYDHYSDKILSEVNEIKRQNLNLELNLIDINVNTISSEIRMWEYCASN